MICFSWIVCPRRILPNGCLGHWKAQVVQEGVPQLPEGPQGNPAILDLNFQ
jgi:hypothetical protein